MIGSAEQVAGDVGRHALVPAGRDERVDVPLAGSTAGSMTSRPAGRVSPSPAACAATSSRRGEQDAPGDAALLADRGRLQRARLGALRQHDPPVGRAGGGGQPAAEGGRAQPGHVASASGTPASQLGSSASATTDITQPARSASSTGTSGSTSCTSVAVS